MTAYYVRSGAAGTGTGASWANAYTTLAAALSGKAAGDTFYISEDHAESSGSTITLTFPGSAALPNLVLCVNHSGSVPPVSADLTTGASIVSSGADVINGTGWAYIRGIQFKVGSTGSQQITFGATSSGGFVFKNSKFWLSGNTSATFVQFGNLSASVPGNIVLRNSTFKFANTGQFIKLGLCRFLWEDTATPIDAGGVVPTVPLLQGAADACGEALIQGVDLSAIGSGGTIVGTGGSAGHVTLQDCKLDAAVTLATTPIDSGTWVIDAVRCDSGGTNYKTSRVSYMGTLSVETTIVRTGGASDGTTPISWKIVTTANSSWIIPFECPLTEIWNDTVGSPVTATIEGIWGGGAVPNNDDIWIEAEYLGSSGSPLASFVSDSKADILATGAGHTSSSETWGGSTTKFKMAVTFTPQQKGWVLLRVRAAKVSSTFYVDPKVTLS